MAWSAIDDQITREFSFIQEMVWGAPYRNPFPSCTNKIISDLKALNVSLSSNRYKSFRNENATRTSKLDASARILDCDALKLIELRRLYCNRLLKLQRVLGEEKLLDLENKVDRILVQHIQRAWQNGLEGSDQVDWMIEAEATRIDFTVLEKSVSQMLDCFQRENKIKPEDLSHSNRDNPKNTDKVSRVEDPRLTEQSSCSPQTFSDNEEESSCDSSNESLPKSSLIPSENKTDEEIIELENDKLCIHSPNTNKTVRLTHLAKGGERIAYSPLSWAQFAPNSQRKNQSSPHLEVEMVMKSRLRRNPEGGAYLWHIIFGLVNHGACKLEVNSLSFWSIDRSSGSDVCSIKWPKGDVILLEGPSFLCYSTKMPCNHANYDSPRVAYSWKYRRLEKIGSSRSKRHEGMHPTSMCESPTEKGEENFEAGEVKKDSNLKTPIYKRLGSIMLDWSANSLKRMRRSTLDI